LSIGTIDVAVDNERSGTGDINYYPIDNVATRNTAIITANIDIFVHEDCLPPYKYSWGRSNKV
jgi:hypothetical protein